MSPVQGTCCGPSGGSSPLLPYAGARTGVNGSSTQKFLVSRTTEISSGLILIRESTSRRGWSGA